MKIELKTNVPNGIFTLLNKATKTYVTFKISTVRNGELKGKRIISKLVGSDNVNSYKGMAFLNNYDSFNLWKKYRNNPKNAQTISILLGMLKDGEKSPFLERIELKASKNCLRCNRLLTTPQSIDDGIGPECIKKGMAF